MASQIVAGLEEFANVLESGMPLAEKLTCRSVSLERSSRPRNPQLARTTRDLLGASQGVFAEFLGVSVKTIRAWEQGRQQPSEMACRFLDEIQRNPKYWRTRLRDSVVVKNVPGDK